MDNLYEMLEHMTNIGVLVFAEGDHNVLYCNRTFRNAFPKTVIGETCDALFCGEYQSLLLECLTMHEGKKENPEKKRIMLRMPEFGGPTEINLNEFLWNEKQEAYILYFCPRYINEEERFRDEAEKAVNSALATIYPVVAAVNLTGNAFMVFESDEEFGACMERRGNFTERFKNKLLGFVHPEEYDLFMQKCDRDYLLDTFHTGDQEVHLEFRLKKSDGRYHWTALRFVRIFTEDHERVSCIALIRGVDYRMNERMKLKAALDATYSAIPGGVVEFLVDDNMTILRVNHAFCELAGKSAKDYANGYREHIYIEDREEITAAIREAAGESRPFDVVYRIIHGQTGKIRWVQCRGVKIDEMDGLAVYLGIRLDVTELKTAQIDLLEERARANLAMGSTGIIRYEFNEYEDTLSLYFQTEESGQMQKAAIENYHDAIIERGEVHPEDIDKLLSVFSGESKAAIEVRLKNRLMEHYEWYRIQSSGVSDSAGRRYIVGIMENIQKERQLKFINRNLQEQIEFVVRESFRRIYVIDTTADRCTIMFMDSEKHKGPVITSFHRLVEVYERSRIHPADLDVFKEKYRELTTRSELDKSGDEIYFDARVRDGFGPDYHWYTLLIKPIKNEKQRFVCLVKCVDEAKQQEELARKIKEQIKYKKFSEKIIDSLGILVEFRDGDSGAHIMRTRQLTNILLAYLKDHASTYHFTDEEIEKMATASAMHDVGKISIPDAILNKPGRFTAEEFEIMKTHTVKGYNILKKLDLGQDEEFNRYCLEICRWHHERYDGKGYPDHLVGDQIPIWSQIVGIVDVYDALVSPRVYKSAYSHEKAMDMIIHGECGRFNPELLESLKACEGQLRACYE